MNSLSLRALTAVVCLSAPAVAGGLPGLAMQQALTGAPGCGHVLDLLLRHGLAPSGELLHGGAVVPSPHGAFVLPAAEIGDLCIAHLAEVPSDAGCPPTFCVAVTNNSARAICNVQISLVALLGPIKPFDPTANACLAEIPAGATVEIEITMPPEALAMGADRGVAVGFQKLLVAIDSLDAYAEANESNNLQLVCRADIPLKVIEATTAVTEVTAPATVEAPAAAAPQTIPGTIDSALEQFGLDSQGETTAERL